MQARVHPNQNATATQETLLKVVVNRGHCYRSFMRKIGELPNEQQARTFGDALYVRGLDNDVEEEDGGSFSVWVHDDDQLSAGRDLLTRFAQDPSAAEWQASSSTATKKRKEEEKADIQRASNVITRERLEYERNYTGFAWLPMLLIILSLAATIWAGELGLALGREPAESAEEVSLRDAKIRNFQKLALTEIQRIPVQPFHFEPNDVDVPEAIGQPVFSYRYDPSLPEIRRGEIWRLFTPVLVHFGIIHLIFNILWVRDLGGFIQHRYGAFYLAVLILAIAGVSNLVQFVWGKSPNFGGLSGVNYGLLGFLWMRGRFDRGSVWRLNPAIIQWMMVWFVLCFTPLVPNVANGAHAGGLAFGMLIGFTTAQLSNAGKARL